jgi:hypothetical protein
VRKTRLLYSYFKACKRSGLGINSLIKMVELLDAVSESRAHIFISGSAVSDGLIS